MHQSPLIRSIDNNLFEKKLHWKRNLLTHQFKSILKKVLSTNNIYFCTSESNLLFSTDFKTSGTAHRITGDQEGGHISPYQAKNFNTQYYSMYIDLAMFQQSLQETQQQSSNSGYQYNELMAINTLIKLPFKI